MTTDTSLQAPPPAGPPRTWWRLSFARIGGARQARAAAAGPGPPAAAAASPPAARPALGPAAALGLPEAQVPYRERRVAEGHLFPAWPLLAVLAVQAALSLRLVRADTAYQDEALSLHAGHLEWAHWLHGTPIPPFPAYFSGVPVIYPPIGALADSAGGLAGARILSLVFMLGATVLLWNTVSRLFGRQAAFFAAAMFAVLGPALHLGAFATDDAPSLFLITLAAWCVVRAGDRGEATGWMAAAGAALALANAAAYLSVLFDLVVIVLALLTAWPAAGWFLAARRAATVLITAAALVAAGLLIGGSSYLGGFERTTLARVPGSASPSAVLADSWSWAGLIVVLAVCGVVLSGASRPGAARTWLLAVLAAAAVLGPLEQAHQHTAATLNEHVGLGAWFAAIAAGYAVDRFIEAAPAGRNRVITCGACLIGLSFPAVLGAGQSWSLAANWPNATAFTGVFGPLADHGTGHILLEDPSVAEYYLPAGTQWQRWSSTRNIVLAAGTSTGGPAAAAPVTAAGNAPVFANYIAAGYFSLVALNFTDTTSLDRDITSDLRRNHHYHIIQVVPYGTEIPPIGQGTYIIWQYRPGPPGQPG
jgi:hypothetical protein